ncbi:hypothetical protein CR513_13430, partial [Mucuna pruriens]
MTRQRLRRLEEEVLQKLGVLRSLEDSRPSPSPSPSLSPTIYFVWTPTPKRLVRSKASRRS